jgi:lysophospholipase L1-like esterase
MGQEIMSIYQLFFKQIPSGFVLLLCCWIACAQSSSQTSPPAKCQEELQLVKDRLARLNSRLQDWSNLGYYRDANMQLTSRKSNEHRVVFMGDSITDFWDNPGSGGFFPGKPYVNRGISGQRTPQMLVRFRQDVIDFDPSVVVILAGTNDLAGNIGPTTLAEIESNLTSMFELAQAHGIRVVFASLLPVNDYSHSRDGEPLIRTAERPLTRIETINSWIKRYAAKNGLTYLDYFDAVADDKRMLRKELSDDGVHPNSQGYAVMAPLAEAAIRRALKTRSHFAKYSPRRSRYSPRRASSNEENAALDTPQP